MSGAESPAGDPHPGTVVTKDLIRATEKEDAAADLPQLIAWVDVAGVWKPVVTIEITGTPERMRITKFGADGEMLESMAPPPPPPM